MDILLDRVTSQAMSYAIRSGIAITAHYAATQGSRLLKQIPRGQERDELFQVQARLESKIRIVSPAIDMIELISARGNSTLESAVTLTKEIRYDIQKLGIRLSHAANDEELLQRKSSRAKSREENERALSSIIACMRSLLVRIEDAVPLISLALTASGVNLSTKLSGTISPSRLLQASTFLTASDTKYTLQSWSRQQVGPTYLLSLYMLFAGHAWRPVDDKGVRETTWKEVMHKAQVKLVRVPLHQLYSLPGESTTASVPPNDSIPADVSAAEFAYQLVIIEDLDDGRFHNDEDGDLKHGTFDGVLKAGIRDVVPVHEVSKVFYADTGKILNIGGDSDENSPVLLLKRDVHAEPPRRMLHRSQMGGQAYDDYFNEQTSNGHNPPDDQSDIDTQLHCESHSDTPQKEPRLNRDSKWRLPPDLDPEWLAFEVWTEESSDSESDGGEKDSAQPTSSSEDSPSTFLAGALSKLNFRSSAASSPAGCRQLVANPPAPQLTLSPHKVAAIPIKTSLSLLEMLLKLTALQQFRQDSHLSIEDELLNFFLEDSATAGAGPDKDHRQRIRHAAVRRVGFDPYDESPIKRRTEEYIHHPRGAASPRPAFNTDTFPRPVPYDEAYECDETVHAAKHLQTYGSDLPTKSSPAATLSSPFPRRPILQQTPSRTSTPDSFSDETCRNTMKTETAGTSSPPRSPHSSAAGC